MAILSGRKFAVFVRKARLIHPQSDEKSLLNQTHCLALSLGIHVL